jgi:phosphoribosylanthranilate isomerase
MKLKFCGFKTLEDVKLAENLNCDALGFIHYSNSKRFVTVKEIRHLTKNIPNDKEIVVIVVNPTIEQINDLVAETCTNYNSITWYGIFSFNKRNTYLTSTTQNY